MRGYEGLLDGKFKKLPATLALTACLSASFSTLCFGEAADGDPPPPGQEAEDVGPAGYLKRVWDFVWDDEGEEEGPPPGFYVGVNFGPARPLETESDLGVHAEYQGSVALRLRGGYDFRPFRVEGEINFLSVEIDDFRHPRFLGNAPQPGIGDVDRYGFLVNAYYDYYTGTPFTPFLGLGYGAAYIDVNKLTALGFPTFLDDDWVMAAQSIMGVAYKLTDLVDLTLNYRFMVSDNVSMTAPGDIGFVSNGISSHSIEVGIRHRF